MSFAFDSALPNAMTHDGFDPNLRHISFHCDKCHHPFFYEVMSEEYPLKNGRMNIRILLCPNCGSRELDCFTTHYLPDYLPGTILPFIGEFMTLSAGINDMLIHLELENPGQG